ncbi:MAG: VWA domain-containing protein [Planctomycetes bacterium]|nr:VWA domain-containing protein [Planctomycetota bacterium]
MSLTFNHPVLAYTAALIALCSLAFFWRRGVASGLIALAAALFALAGAGPSAGGGAVEARHAAVLDVSASMESRLEGARRLAVTTAIPLPPGQSWLKQQLSDTLRDEGSPPGGQTNYGALAALSARPDFLGECIFISDGRGDLDELTAALDPGRVILLRAPVPEKPDAAVVSLRVPGNLPAGSAAVLRAEIACDRDLDARWRAFADGKEIGNGHERLAAGASVAIAQVFRAPDFGLMRLSITVEVAGDREPRNDKASVAVGAAGKRVVAYALPAEVAEASDALLALIRADAANEVRVRRDLPTAGELTGIAALVINDVPVASLDAARLPAIAAWVRGGGRVLMAGVGGAFGPGGWRGTPLEEVSPLKFRPDDDPGRRWLLLLDCSDSMNASAGGAKRLDVMRQGARRVLDKLNARDRGSVVGFNRHVLGSLEFTDSVNELRARLDNLTASGNTNIRASLEAALRAFPPGDGEARIFLVTDGQEGEGSGGASYAELAKFAADNGIRIDVLLTEATPRPWTDAIKAGGGSVNTVGERGFGELVEKLEQIAAGADKSLIEAGPFAVAGVAASVPAVARTAPRADLQPGDLRLSANKNRRNWPLLATRQMLGRSAALTCETWGGELWRNAKFLDAVRGATDFLLTGAANASLKLNVNADDSADLTWVGLNAAPERDLELEDSTRLRLTRPGRWHVAKLPQADELAVFDTGRLIEKLALPQLPPAELRFTGDDEEFFTRAAARGFRVLKSLQGWEPRVVRPAATGSVNLTWLVAAFGVACVLAGYAMRKK